MANEQLVAHIRTELSRGIDKTVLIQELAKAGWKVEDITAALSEVSPMVPAPAAPAVPKPSYAQNDMAPREVSGVKTMVQNTASGLFVASVLILTVISVMGVWKVFSNDVITKSFETLGLLAFVSVIVIVASKFVGDPNAVAMGSDAFRPIRNITLGTLVVSSALLALLGVLSIWDVISDKNILYKSLSSLAIIAFSSFIVVLVSLEREQNDLWKKRGGQFTGVGVIVTFLFLWMMISLFSHL